MSEMGNAELFFDAKTIAVVGAARENWKVGHIIFKNLLKSRHLRVFPVNPNAKEILGQKCFRDILEIPYEIDLAIIAVKPELAPEIMIQAGKKKIPAVTIVSSGFSEIGNSGLEEQIKEIAIKNNIALMGPNCFGFLSPFSEINTTFFEGMPEKGRIAFISQSGALGVGVLDIALKEKIGLSGFVSLGNSAMLDFSDFIEYFAQDKRTGIIALYMEGLKEARGRRFIEACRKASRIKPIVVLKSGKSRKGAEAAKSHTASLASEKGVYESIFRQAGLIEVDSISELFYAAEIYSRYSRLGRKACIVTNAGGLGVLCTDSCEKNGIEIVQFDYKTIENLRKMLPKEAAVKNPVDVVGDALAERYEKVLKLLESEKSFDFFIVLLTPQYMTQPVETAKILTGIKKPVVACFMGGEKTEKAKEYLRGKVPVFNDVIFIGKAIGKLIHEK